MIREEERERMDTNIPPGYRFSPTEDELVNFYLQNKLDNTTRVQDIERVIPLIDVNAQDPWHLPQMAGESSIRDSEQWFFLVPMQQREAQGGRPARTTPSGYWKATGTPTGVYHNNRMIAVKKTMVFYQGRAPLGNKTKWKMNEYKALLADTATTPSATPKLRNEFSLCRVYIKSGSQRSSFDRRPEMDSRRMGEASSSSSSMMMVPMVAERASSPDSSSSGEHRNNEESGGGAAAATAAAAASGDVQMAEDMVDLELLDWL